MRSENEIMDLLNAFYQQNEDIRLFSMNGSKINPTIPDDKFKDYDVVFFTDDIEKYTKSDTFLQFFGEILIQTEPEAYGEPLYPAKDGYTYLVQYSDGTRIDFQFMKLARLTGYLKADRLTKILGDKDTRVKKDIVPDDSDYWLKKPAKEEVLHSVKEFWWQFNSTLKACLREELLLAQFYLSITRDELIKLIAWTIAIDQGFEKNYGKKYTKILTFLPSDEVQQIMCTFDTSSKKQLFSSLKQLRTLEIRYSKRLAKKMAVSESDFSAFNHVPIDYLISKGETELASFFQLD